MAWKTNKSLSNEYPEYIIYHLDYSKNRKEPLNRQMRITNDENQMWEIYDGWIKSEMAGTKGVLKKGWNLYNSMDSREN